MRNELACAIVLAIATVASCSKGINSKSAEMSVQVRYTLHKEGDKWVVQSSSGMGSNPHGGGMPQSRGQGDNPHEDLGLPTTRPPSSQPQPAPSH